MNKIFNNKTAVISTVLAVSIIAIVASLFIFNRSQENVEASEWFNESWLYRRSFDVGNNTATENNVYISATLDTSATGKFQSDCGDLRFTDSGGNLLDYYIASGCGTTSTVTHIEFDTLPTATSTVYYYYGNSSVANGFVSNDFATEASNYYVGSTTAEEQGPGPVIYWNFDKGYGTTVSDNASSGYDGSITAATWMNESECRFGKCLYFDGSGDYVDATNFSNVPAYSKGTLSFWVKLNRWAAVDNVLGLQVTATNNDAFRLEYNSDGRLRFIIGNSSGSYNSIFSANPITLNKWHFVTLTWDSTANKATLYVDNTSSQSSITTWPTTYTGFRVGTAYTGRYAQGFIDEMKLYNYDRTSDQVKQDYNQGLSSAFGSYSDDNLSNGLIGYWKMDESASSTCATANYDSCDSSGNNNDANWSADAFATTTSKYGRSVDMDGTGDFMLVDSSSSLDSYTDGISMAGWFYLDALSTTKYFFDKQNNFYFRVSSTGAVTLYLFGIDNPTSLTTASGVVTTGNWFHIAFTYDGSSRRIYVNGKIKAEDIKSGSVSSGGGLYIASQASGTNPIDGRVDEVRLYNAGLSPTEIRRLYEWAPEPVGWWKMDEGSGSTINDISGNDNSGTIDGALTKWVSGKYGRSLEFNNSDDGVSIANADILEAPSSFTIMGWVNFGDLSQNQSIIYRTATRQNYYLWITSSGSLYAGFRNSADTAWQDHVYNFNPDLNRWYHIAAVFDDVNNKFKIYINGNNVLNETENDTPYISEIQTLYIGDGGAGNFSGKIDDVKVYNYARTPKQILEDMNAGKMNNPIAYWSFDKGQGTTAYNYGVAKQVADSSHDAVITGATWRQSDECKIGNCLNFDGNDWVEDTTGFNLSGNNQVSFSFWINSTWDFDTGDSTGYQSVLVQQLDWNYLIGLTHQSAGVLSMTHRNGGTLDRAIVQYDMTKYKNKWVHVVGIYNAGNYKLYINGELVAEADGSYNTISSSLDGVGFGIANNTYANRYLAQSKIDEVKVYNYAITQEEIDQNYNQGKQNVLSKSRQEVRDGGDGLVGWWKMDETTWSGVAGEVVDSSGAGNHGTSTNAVSTSTAKFGRAGYFDGVGDYIEIPDTNNIVTSANNSRTVSLWFRADTTGSQRALISAGDTSKDATPLWLMTQRASNVLSIYHGGSYLDGSSTLSSGVWYYATYTYDRDSNVVVLYLNGREEYRGIVPDVNNTSPSIFIGDGYNAEFSGEIDDVKIYNYARTPDQVMRDYMEGPPPIAYWKMDEKSGATTVDNTGNGNDGAITGATWGSSADCKIGSCLSFDGSGDDDYVEVINFNNDMIDRPYSFTAWIKPIFQIGGNDESIVGKNRGATTGNSYGLGLKLNDSNLYGIAANNNSAWRTNLTYDISSYENQWIYVAFTISGLSGTQTGKLYVDGNKVAEYTGVAGYYSVYPFLIGNGKSSAFEGEFNGEIDEVKVWDYVLTPYQVAQEYNNGAPVRYWKFDKGEGGTAYDYSGNGNDGTIYPGTAGTNTATSTMWSNGVNGKINGSLDFDGTDDYVSIPIINYDYYTIKSWFKTTAFTGTIYSTTLGTYSNPPKGGIQIINGKARFYIGYIDSAYRYIESKSLVNDGIWHHIVAISDTDKSYLYIDGELQGTSSYTSADSLVVPDKTSVGVHLDSDPVYKAYFDGQIDEVKIWNYALAPDDIKREYNGGFGIYFK